MNRLALLVLILLVGAQEAGAEAERRAPLTLQQVSQSAATHFPEVLEGLARLRAAQGEAQGARGAFDLVFATESSHTLSGFYDGQTAGARLVQPIAPFGGRIEGGYRVSRGTFPVYRDIAFTNRAGEFKLGAYFSLLRDRGIDERRLAIINKDQALEAASFELMLTRVGVQQRAQEAYWRWVATGRQLSVYEDLLRLAEDRERGLLAEVRSGARAQIFLTENRQNITRRQIAAAEARRAFETAANALSYYYRDADGEPLRPGRTELPSSVESERVDLAGLDAAAAAALSVRPEFQLIATALRRAEADLAFARNLVKPRLDLAYEVSNDFGEIGQGGVSRDGAENIVGLKFELPLQRREGRGATQRAEADYEALRQRLRRTRDQIEIELQNILLDLGFAAQLTELARLEVEQAETLSAAERRRFRDGASDFFLVNFREEAAANAKIRQFEAEFERAAALTRFRAATVDLDALFLGDAASL